jgi:hypothetical protein
MNKDPSHNPPDTGVPAPEPSPPPESERARRLIARRALVRAGWILPVVMAIPLPLSALAQYNCAHTDVPASAHVDVPASAHVDAGIAGAHVDTPASLHTDAGGNAHTDACA